MGVVKDGIPFKKLAEDVREDPILLPLAAIGITRGLVEVILIPTIMENSIEVIHHAVNMVSTVRACLLQPKS